jgi:hypothetical protein
LLGHKKEGRTMRRFGIIRLFSVVAPGFGEARDAISTPWSCF